MKMKNYIMMPVLFVILLVSVPVVAQQSNGVTNSVCRLFADVGNTSSVMTYIQEGTAVQVEEKYGDYYFIKYDSTGGFVLVEKIDLMSDAEYKDYSVQPEQTPQDANYQQNVPADRYNMLVQKYGEQTGKALFELKIWKGIDHNMVRDSWGKPFQVSREIKGSYVYEEWDYPKSRLIFRDGVLVDWIKF